MPNVGDRVPEEKRASDPRDPRPCRVCQVMLGYDGWALVHREGRYAGFGEAECAMRTHDAAHTVLAEDLTSLDVLPAHKPERGRPTERQDGESWGSYVRRVSDYNRAKRSVDHGHVRHSAFFDGLIDGCPGCERLFDAKDSSHA